MLSVRQALFRRDRLEVLLFSLTFALTLAPRVWGITDTFQLLRDQIRDWEIALRPFSDLPLVGPATHVGGYTIGPAFYWMLWAIRVTVGPWFDYLPHAGGIGQAILHSAADALLLIAIWRRTGSIWVALCTVGLTASAAFDLALSGLVWNPVAGTTLAKAAVALLLLDWHRGAWWKVAVLVALAWSAVHAYTGAIFVAGGILLGVVFDPLCRREGPCALRNAVAAVFVIALLQVPYVIHQARHRFQAPAMGAVSGSVSRILSGEERPRVQKSIDGYVAAVRFIETAPRGFPYVGSVLLVCGAIVAVVYRRDPAMLAATLVPQLAAVAGYALFLDDLDHYYYLSVMPSAVLTVALGVLSWPPRRVSSVVGSVLFVGVLLLAPEKFRSAQSMHRMPEYRILVNAARRISALRQPMRAIEAEFPLPPTADPDFMYRILGGEFDPASPWVASIMADGRVEFRKVD